MEIEQQRCPLLDVNDVIDAIKRYAPRCRWFCLNSDYFGPHFSGPALLGYSLTDLERVLEKPQFSWLNWVNRQGKKFLWRPRGGKPFQDGDILESTKNNFPVMLYFDSTNGPPRQAPEDQLDAVRVGWDNLDNDLRDAITATVLAGAFGFNAPAGGWEGIETPRLASLPKSRTRSGGHRASAPKPMRERVRLPSVADAPRRASAPAALARPLDGDGDAVEPSPAPRSSLAEQLRAIGQVVADRDLAERDECISAFFDGCVRGRHSDRRKQMREIVGVLTSEDDAVDFDDDLTAVKRGLHRRRDGYASENDRKGVGAYVKKNGTLVPWDYKEDLLLKRKAAPRWMDTLRQMLRVRRWHQDQDRAKRSKKHGNEFYDYHTKRKLPGDSTELATFIDAREAGLELQLSMISDVIINANCNGGTEVITQGLAYVGLAFHIHGLSHTCQDYQSAMGLNVAYGTLRKLEHELVASYRGSWDGLLERLIAESPRRTRGGPSVNVVYPSYTDAAIARLMNAGYRRAEAICWLLDNYCKLLKARRHLRVGDVNSGVITTQTNAAAPMAENLLIHPETEGLRPINAPFDSALFTAFMGGDVGFTTDEGCAVACYYDFNDDYDIFTPELCPAEPRDERFYLHEWDVAPQLGGSSSSRRDVVKHALLPLKEALAKGLVLFWPGDTEYAHHLEALLMATLPRRRLPLSMAPKRASKRQSKLGDDLVVLDECPKLDASLEGAVVEIDMMEWNDKDGIEAWRLHGYQGIVEHVYGPDEGDAVAKEILRQCRLREEFVKADAGAVDDAKPEAVASAESVARTRAVDEKAGGKNGRWVYVKWGKSDEPGYCMNMFSPETYSVKQKRKKKGLQHWRAFREREDEEG